MPGRSYVGSNGYRYGFNGKEKDDEVKGAGNQLDFGARIYDPRIGKWLSLDPEMSRTPNLSPYSYVSNCPIFFMDYKGKTLKPTNEKAELALDNYISSFDVKNEDGTTKINSNDIFGLVKTGKGGNYSSNLNMSISNFTKKAKAAGLNGPKLESAIALYQVLTSQAVIEVGILAPTKENELASIPGRGAGYSMKTDNSNLSTALQTSGGAQGINSPTENITEKDIDGLLQQGDLVDKSDALKGTGFSIFVSDNEVSQVEGILIIKEGVPVDGAIKSAAKNFTQPTLLDEQNKARRKGKSDED